MDNIGPTPAASTQTQPVTATSSSHPLAQNKVVNQEDVHATQRPASTQDTPAPHAALADHFERTAKPEEHFQPASATYENLNRQRVPQTQQAETSTKTTQLNTASSIGNDNNTTVSTFKPEPDNINEKQAVRNRIAILDKAESKENNNIIDRKQDNEKEVISRVQQIALDAYASAAAPRNPLL